MSSSFKLISPNNPLTAQSLIMKLTSFFAVFLLAVSTVLAVTSPAPPVAGSTVGASTLDVAVIEAGNVEANENFDAGKELAVRQIRPPASNHLGGVIDLIVSVVQIIRESIEVSYFLMFDQCLLMMLKPSDP